MNFLVPCKHCEGTGKVTVPEHLNDILICLSVNGPMTTREMLTREIFRNLTSPALNMRLRALATFGIVQRKRTLCPSGGIEYVWQIADG